MMKRAYIRIPIFFLLLCVPLRLTAIPPHPNLRDKIRQGAVPEPYYLKNLNELRRSGVDNPLVNRKLSLPKRTEPSNILHTIATPADWNLLVILIDFEDKQHLVEPAFFDSLIFDTTSISVRDYYREVSYGNLDLVTVNLPSQTGWVQADSSATYYTTDQYGNPNGGFGPYPRNAQKLVEEAVLAVNPVVDFSNYDNDRNGRVDGLLVVHAGTGGEAEGNEENIWSHFWVTSDTMHLESGSDRVIVYEYAIVPEYWLFGETRFDMTIGVVAHELGHSLFGLPDFYDRDGSSDGLGGWSLMASGSWNGPLHIGGSPSHPDAWSRSMMGFATAQNVTANLMAQSIAPVEIFPQLYRLWTDGKPAKEYFLVENRLRYGYDEYIPRHGLLVYHVDENVDMVYAQNDHEWYPGYTNHGHYLVALEQADGEYGLEHGDGSDSGDPFPGLAFKSSFSNISSPSSLAYNGEWTGVGITRIADLDTGIVADFTVIPTSETITAVSITDIPNDEGGEVQISWYPVAADDGISSTVAGYSIWLQGIDPQYSAGMPVLPYDGGHWAYSGFQPANGDSIYEIIAHTYIDSNTFGFHKSMFRIAAQTADSLVIALSNVLEGYSVDDLPPLPPMNLTASFIGGIGVRLIWEASPSTDLGEYRIYRGETSVFTPVHIDSFLAATADTVFTDTSPDPVFPYYRVAAIDSNGNAGDFTPSSAPDTIIVAHAASPDIPLAYQLYQNFPNPFNPNTTIRFDLPIADHVRILVFDLKGREIRRLVNDRFGPGRHLLQWDGRSENGNDSPAGIYLLRLETSHFTANRKMLLLK